MTQTQKIKLALDAGQTLTPLDALKRFGCFRLGARIWDLRQQGYPVQTIRHRDGYAMYRKVNEEAEMKL